jgi:hypothetical protein
LIAGTFFKRRVVTAGDAIIAAKQIEAQVTRAA